MATSAEYNGEWLVTVKEDPEKDRVEAGEGNSDVCIFGISYLLFMLKPEAHTYRVVNSTQREISQDVGRFQESNHLAVTPQNAYCLPQLLDLDIPRLYYYVTAASREPRQSESRSNPLGEGCILNVSKMVSTTIAGYLPSATELNVVGIEFAPYDSGDLREISFKRTTSTFLLPKITINNSVLVEVVWKDLVAFELSLNTEQKPLTCYTYLMGRLIPTEGDAALLERCGVVNCQMGSHAEVAQMWNSMGKTIGENTFDPVDKAIEEANKYYRSKRRVLLVQFLKTHCSKLWQIIKVLCAGMIVFLAEFWRKHGSKLWLVMSVLYGGMMLLFAAVQVFCLFHTCNK